MRKKQFFLFFSRIFSNFEQKFFRLLAKKLQKVFKTTYLSRGIVCSLKFFSKVLNCFGSSAETFGMVPKLLSSCVQSKNCGKNSFFCFSFQSFFGFWAKNFSDFQPINFRKLSKLPSACPEEHFVTIIFFEKFWIVLDLLQKPLAWFPNFYIRVQSKNCGKKQFFLFFFQNFFKFWAKFFSDFRPKNFKKFSKLPTCPEEKFVTWFFFKFSNVSDFLQKHLAWFSKFYLRVQSKNCGKNRFFLFSFQNFFEFWAKLFRLSAKKLQKVFKTTYVSRGKVCDLVFF